MVDAKLQKLIAKLYRDLAVKQKVYAQEFQLKNNITSGQYQQISKELLGLGLELKQTEKTTQLLTTVALIEVEKIEQQLKTANISTPIKYLFSTKSTNIVAKQSSNEAIIIADHQSSGYGRKSRQWISPLSRCIALSIKHKFELKLHQLAGLNIAVGVAIINTMKHFNQNQLGLKWPNDVIGDKGKVAGILIEATGNTKQNIEVVIGIGINWNLTPEQFESVEQNCMNAGIKTELRSDFIAQLLLQLYTTFKEFTKNQLNKLKHDWHQHDIYLNQTVQLTHEQSVKQGKYLGIDATGALRLQINDKTETVINGEVSLRPVTLADNG